MTTDDRGEARRAVGGDLDVTEGATVLVVDDEDPVVTSFSVTLEEEGYDVRTAGNGGEAIVEFGPDVDVVLLDRRMPGMSGDEVLEHIEAWKADCRVAMVTAVDPEVQVDVPFDEYLTKPVGRDELLDTVEQLLLFDRYEELLREYHSLSRKYATTKATIGDGEFEDHDAVAALEERRQSVRADLEETVDRFSDEGVRAALQRAHGELPTRPAAERSDAED